MSEIQCPYCHAEQEVCHDDGQGYDENKRHEMQCGECKMYFVFTTHIIFDYEPAIAPCLNGERHDLAEKVGVLLGVDVGEHTSNNCPVENALGAIEEKEAEQARQDCYVSVPIDAVNWLKEKFPRLCIKAGLCVKVGGRLYTKTIVEKG